MYLEFCSVYFITVVPIACIEAGALSVAMIGMPQGICSCESNYGYFLRMHAHTLQPKMGTSSFSD